MKKNPENSFPIISIESFGGTEGLVTGSCHRLSIKNSLILVDYGLFQGRDEKSHNGGINRNSEPVKDIANGVTDVLETHVHIDHSGRLPLIFKKGFTPRILATKETAIFMEPMLYNSAKIQENEKSSQKLYGTRDVDKTLSHLKIIKPFELIPIGQKHDRVTAEFLLNGHVMGSSSIVIREHGGKKNILFTGDMGKPNQSLCGGYTNFVDQYPNDPINVMVVESTSFDKDPVSFEEKRKGLLAAINEVWEGKGNPVIPALSFHRTPEIMEMLHNCQENGDLPEDCQIIIDAPLAMELLDTFKKELGSNCLSNGYGDDPEFYKTIENSINRFNLKNVTIIKEHKESVAFSKKAANSKERLIIIASGGMGGHGRSVNYTRGEFGNNPRNAVVQTCFQVPGTEGAKLLEKGRVTNGKNKGARVVKIEGFTSHISGSDQTFGFLERFNLSNLEKVIITHGKDKARITMANDFKRRGYGAEIILSKIHQIIEI